MRHATSSAFRTALHLAPGIAVLLLAACAGRGASTEARDDGSANALLAAQPYVECAADGGCADGDTCVMGLCLPQCGGGDACVEGAICGDGECTLACDDASPCGPGFTCSEGECATDPCAHPAFWPLSIASETLPVLVHFRDEAERDEAMVALAAVEHSWDIETRVLGFEPPLPDNGTCGPDGRFDVFVWRTWRGGVSDVISDNPETEWDDTINYLILDPWGPYGGDALDATTAHELNHAMHAVHDWNETPIFFEMSAQFIEDLVYDEDNAWRQYLADFQRNADWSLVFNDDYETYYMYGSALYLLYLRDAVFAPLAGEAPDAAHGAFLSEVWRNARNPAGNNEPDFVDALDALLQERAQMTFLDTVVGFARWRWFTGSRDDGAHFEEGAELPAEAMVPVLATIDAAAGAGQSTESDVMLLGSRYVVVQPDTSDAPVALAFSGDDAVRWSIQVFPAADGSEVEVVDAATGAFELALPDGARTVAITALPHEGVAWDADEVDDSRYGFTLRVN